VILPESGHLAEVDDFVPNKSVATLRLAEGSIVGGAVLTFNAPESLSALRSFVVQTRPGDFFVRHFVSAN
jgi:hypothetical protein